jgi:hypothetical protein
MPWATTLNRARCMGREVPCPECGGWTEIFVAPDFEAVDRRMQRAGFRDPEAWFIQQRDTLAFPIPHGGIP